MTRADMTSKRICAVCRWRELDPDRTQTCRTCQQHHRQQLNLLATLDQGLLTTIYRNEPTHGHPNINLLDLTLTAHTPTPTDPHQTGNLPTATLLTRWIQTFAGNHAHTLNTHRAAQWHQTHHHQTINHPQYPQFADDLHHAYNLTLTLINRAHKPTQHPAPCPHCHTPGQPPTLQQNPGQDWTHCRRCGNTYTPQELATLTQNAIPPTTPLTATQAAHLLGIPAQRIRKWAHRGLITPTTPHHYRYDQLQQLATH